MTETAASASQIDAAWSLILRAGLNVSDEAIRDRTGVSLGLIHQMRGASRRVQSRKANLTGHYPIDDGDAEQIANHRAWRVVRCMAGSGISQAELVERAGVDAATVHKMQLVAKNSAKLRLPISGFWLRDSEGQELGLKFEPEPQ